MPKINILPREVYSLIAAGEVVERPSSVVKEMLENSVDAGAKRVVVEIRAGGVGFLRVTDDGCGIAREDVPKAFISHATSKVRTGADLDAIATLGFRGEALASVAAVAKVEMLTRTPDEEFGTRYCIHCGEEVACDDAGCPVGTTIIVRDLFCSTPARMKFLKKDSTEASYVTDVVTKIALSHPEISFRLLREGKETIFTDGKNDLSDTVRALFGKEIAEGMIPCDYTLNGLRVSGLLTKPLCSRATRNMQYFFVNHRYVRIPAVSAALDEAYKNNIMVGKFPGAVLNIDIAPGAVDINVHPAKTEIRFSNDRPVFETVFYAAKSALSAGDTRPQMKLPARPPVKPVPDAGTQLRFAERRTAAWGELPQKDSAAQEKRENDPPLQNTPAGESAGEDRIMEVRVYAPDGDAPTDRKPEPTILEIRSPLAGRIPLLDRKTSAVLFSRPENRTEKPQPAFVEHFSLSRNRSAVPEEEMPLSPGSQSIADRDSSAAPEEEMPLSPGSQSIADRDSSAAPEEEMPLFPGSQSIADRDSSVLVTEASPETPAVRIIGELFKTYIIAEQGNEMLLVDKHAAHERILFEKIKRESKTGAAQMLLSPVRVILSAKEHDAVLSALPVLEEAGYLAEDFGGSAVLVRGAPVELGNADITDIITELAGELLRGKTAPLPEKLDWLYHSSACRAAVKAGDALSPAEQIALVDRVLQDDSIRYCPHGRPVLIRLKKNEIEKQFGRLG